MISEDYCEFCKCDPCDCDYGTSEDSTESIDEEDIDFSDVEDLEDDNALKELYNARVMLNKIKGKS